MSAADYAMSMWKWRAEKNHKFMSDADLDDYWTMQNARKNISWNIERQGVK